MPVSVAEKIRRHHESFDLTSAYAELAGSGDLDFSLVTELAKNPLTLCVEQVCARVMGSLKATLKALWPITREEGLKSLSTADVEEMDGRTLLPIPNRNDLSAAVGIPPSSKKVIYIPTLDQMKELERLLRAEGILRSDSAYLAPIRRVDGQRSKRLQLNKNRNGAKTVNHTLNGSNPGRAEQMPRPRRKSA